MPTPINYPELGRGTLRFLGVYDFPPHAAPCTPTFGFVWIITTGITVPFSKLTRYRPSWESIDFVKINSVPLGFISLKPVRFPSQCLVAPSRFHLLSLYMTQNLQIRSFGQCRGYSYHPYSTPETIPTPGCQQEK